jgi:hypothetical protein
VLRAQCQGLLNDHGIRCSVHSARVFWMSMVSGAPCTVPGSSEWAWCQVLRAQCQGLLNEHGVRWSMQSARVFWMSMVSGSPCTVPSVFDHAIVICSLHRIRRSMQYGRHFWEVPEFLANLIKGFLNYVFRKSCSFPNIITWTENQKKCESGDKSSKIYFGKTLCVMVMGHFQWWKSEKITQCWPASKRYSIGT